MTNFILWVAGVLGGGVVVYLAARRGYELGKRDGARQALGQIASDLDETIAEWEVRADHGDMARSIELAGLTAFRRMLGK